MKRTIKKNERQDTPSRIKVPHIGPRPRSSGPGTTIVGSKKKVTTGSLIRKK